MLSSWATWRGCAGAAGAGAAERSRSRSRSKGARRAAMATDAAWSLERGESVNQSTPATHCEAWRHPRGVVASEREQRRRRSKRKQGKAGSPRGVGPSQPGANEKDGFAASTLIGLPGPSSLEAKLSLPQRHPLTSRSLLAICSLLRL